MRSHQAHVRDHHAGVFRLLVQPSAAEVYRAFAERQSVADSQSQCHCLARCIGGPLLALEDFFMHRVRDEEVEMLQ